MAYLQQTSWKDRPGAVVGVVAVHAAIGFALINGLSYVSEVIRDKPLVGTEVVVPVEPPPTPTEEATAKVIPDRPPIAPLPPLDISDRLPEIDTTTIILPKLPELPRITPSATPSVTVTPAKPVFDPVPARPRNNPANWVTTNDYRSSWINREWTGTVGFRLQIAADGRVANCTITASSGHAELDAATCDLVSRRARFDPARGQDGERAAGSYASAVRWELPR
ncbi:MAG: energy transducer TonB [Tsuneonella sp.]